MILKIIRSFKEPTQIYTDVDYPVSEEESFYGLSDSVKVQRLFHEGEETEISCIFAVIDGSNTMYVHRDEHAYLLNDAGKTLKIINKP